MKLSLTPQAEIDLDGILTFTARHWDNDQANLYADTLEQVFADILGDPKKDDNHAPERPEILSRRVKSVRRSASHVVFYDITPKGNIRVLRILHEMMDFEGRLDDAA